MNRNYKNDDSNINKKKQIEGFAAGGAVTGVKSFLSSSCSMICNLIILVIIIKAVQNM